MSTHKQVFIIVVLALFLRVINFSFPFFTSEEARIGYRGYALAISGKDELGRQFPLVFNSLIDYQLPLVSYITAIGELIFGKSEFGVRIIFILLGSLLPVLVFFIYQKLQTTNKGFLAALICIFSPTLIFISRIPNSTIVLLVGFSLLFLLIVKVKTNKILYLTIILLLLLTSKIAWFVTLPFVICTFYLFKKHTDFKIKSFFFISCLILSISAVILFLQVPQSKRSLTENNLNIFSENTLLNGINHLRGQGIDSYINPKFEQILFNKSFIITTGLLNWFSNISLDSFFNNFNFVYSFSSIGLLPKILIVPLIIGFVLTLKKSKRILLYPLIFTYPIVFLSPKSYEEIIVLTSIYIIIITASGLYKSSKRIQSLLIMIALVETLVCIFPISLDIKNSNNTRPVFIKQIIQDADKMPYKNIFISDDIISSDIVSYIEWLTDFKKEWGYEKLDYAYKFSQYNVGKFKIIPSGQTFISCNNNLDSLFYLSKRDFDKVKQDINKNEKKIYIDNIGNTVAYRFSNICIN